MHARFEVALSKEEYVVGLGALFGELAKVDPTRGRAIFQRLATFVILLLAIGWFFPESMAGIFVLIISVAVIEAVISKFWIKSAHGASYDPGVGTQIIEFSDAAITETSTMRKREWAWDALRRVHDRQAGLVFEFVGWDMIVLPARLWDQPQERQRFLEEISGFIARPAGEPVSAAILPDPGRQDLFNIAAIGAFVDVCLIVTAFLPIVPRRFFSIASEIGSFGATMAIVLATAALGYAAYRLTKVGLPRLNARSPTAATIVAQSLIWAFAVWFGAVGLHWL